MVKTNAQHRIGNSGADSCKLSICNSIEHLFKCWADVFQMPPPSPIHKPLTFMHKKTGESRKSLIRVGEKL